jgi:esterase/lipase superfamily enzyme
MSSLRHRLSPARRLVLLAAALLVAGCAGRQVGTLVPVAATVPDASIVDMMVATTRAKSTEPGVVFSGERGPTLALDNIVVSIPPDRNRKVGEVTWAVPGDPARDFVTLKVEPMTGNEPGEWFRRVAGKQRRLLVFVHGFNNRYEEAVYRFAQIAHDSGSDAAPVLFTWPSRGNIFAYNYDKESANYSRTALETLLRDAAAKPEIQEITVMAHSMGSWLTMEALRQLSIRDGRLPAKIRNVILASPDLDVDVFSRQLQEIDTRNVKMTIFVSNDDRALDVSRRIAGGVDRVGSIDPNQEPYKSEIERAGITVLDLTALQAGDPTNHLKFAASAEVVKLIGNRLIQGQKVSNSDISLGERIGAAALGTAQTVGSAATTVATAPGALIDPTARQVFRDQAGTLGRNFGGTLKTAVGR